MIVSRWLLNPLFYIKCVCALLNALMIAARCISIDSMLICRSDHFVHEIRSDCRFASWISSSENPACLIASTISFLFAHLIHKTDEIKGWRATTRLMPIPNRFASAVIVLTRRFRPDWQLLQRICPKRGCAWSRALNIQNWSDVCDWQVHGTAAKRPTSNTALHVALFISTGVSTFGPILPPRAVKRRLNRSCPSKTRMSRIYRCGSGRRCCRHMKPTGTCPLHMFDGRWSLLLK